MATSVLPSPFKSPTATERECPVEHSVGPANDGVVEFVAVLFKRTLTTDPLAASLTIAMSGLPSPLKSPVPSMFQFWSVLVPTEADRTGSRKKVV